MGVVTLPRVVIPPELGTPLGRWRGRMWVSDAPLAELDAYERCVDGFGASGLWPLLVPIDLRFATTDWFDDRFGRFTVEQVTTRDAATVLQRWWPGPCCAPECLAPVGPDFPGLVRRSSSRGKTDAEAVWTAITTRRHPSSRGGGIIIADRIVVRLGLVHVARPADVLAVLGWAGAARHTTDAAALSAVLRSWEDRFGARLVMLGVDAIMLSVAAPPTTVRRALGIAAEHRAFCPDGFRRQHHRLADVAESLLHEHIWAFWWD